MIKSQPQGKYDVLEPTEPWSRDLSETELQLLNRIEEGLPLLADVSRADVSLIARQGEEAVIVAQAEPRSISSLYRQPWLGKHLPLAESPLLAAGLVHGRPGQRQLKLLEQESTVIQQVFPVRSSAGRALAVVQIETTLIAWERQRRRHPTFRQSVQWVRSMVLHGDLAGASRLGRFGEWDGILFVDAQYRIRYLSGIANNLYRRLGYLEDLHGQHVGDLQTHDEILVRLALETLECQQHQVEEGTRHWTRTVVPVWSYPSEWWPLRRNGQFKPQVRGALIMVHDDTEARRKAQELQVLSTKIKEVHHRVKNNLQTVASILRMQARRSDSAEARVQLQEAVNRVLAVSVIHEFLSDYDQQSINIREVCQRIATQTQRAVVQPDKQITLQVLGPAIYLPSQQATTCALVANELLLNALEHGYSDRDSGTVTLRLEDFGDQIKLEVADDGSGLPADFDLATADSHGLNIVRTLVEGDLRGAFVLEPAETGTQAVVVFKKGQQDDK